MKRILLSLVLSIGFFSFSSNQVFAAIISQQNVKDTIDNTSDLPIKFIGPNQGNTSVGITGLSSTIRSFIFTFTGNTYTEAAGMQVFIRECNDVALTSGCNSIIARDANYGWDGGLIYVPDPMGSDIEIDFTSATDFGAGNYTDGFPMNPSKYYGIWVVSNAAWDIDVPQLGDEYYYILGDTYSGGGPTDTTTRIETVTPSNNSTVATSTAFTFGATGYLGEADLTSDTKLQIFYKNFACESSLLVGPVYATLAQPCSSNTFIFDLASSGSFSLSTTTSLTQIGKYALEVSILKPRIDILGFTFFDKTIVSTSTVFTASTTTAYDILQSEVSEDLNNFASTASSSGCTIGTGFSIPACTAYLLFPSSQAFSQYAVLPSQMGEKFPFSYVAGVSSTWSELTASTTANSPTISINLAAIGQGSTTPMGNFLPNITAFSSTTVGTYLTPTLLNLLKALASAAIILALVADIFFTTRNMIRT